MLQNNQNRFEKRVNRFHNPVFKEDSYSSFDFNNNLKSIDIPELYFTNFTSSDKCKKYFHLKELCIKISQNYREWNKLFVADEIDISVDVPKNNRLNNIIKTINEDYNKQDLLLKFKNLQDVELQFYIKKEGSVLKLYLIDLYHLGFEARDKKTGRIDLKGKYKAMSKHKHCISDINVFIN